MELDIRRIRAISILGRGAKGAVFLVRCSDSGEILALKTISRSFIEKKSSSDNDDAFRRIWFERDVLASLRHPLLPSLRGFVSTDRIVGFAIDWCPGGNLADFRGRQTEQMFSDETIRFYAAELVLALENLHQHCIVYRDLKPENILIQDTGHIMLVDFDLSAKLPTAESSSDPSPAMVTNIQNRRRRRRPRLFSCFSSKSFVSPEVPEPTETSKFIEKSGSEVKSNSFVGTEDYVAPEIIKGSGHDYGVDWWSLGIVLYEMLYGRTPFRGQNRKETFYRILRMEPELVGEKTALRDLIASLLEKEADRRIGCEDIKRHEFFRGVDWEEILTVSRPPFIPAGVDLEGDGGGEEIDVESRVEEVFGEEAAVMARDKCEDGVRNQHMTSDFDVF